jgi:hypothetical protein
LCLYHGQILQTPQSEKDPRFNPQICRQRNAKSVVAVPVYHDGKVAAVVELVSSQANAFQEHDVRSCQLMAGLVTEAIARAAELEWKQVLAAERATMLSALEKLKPQLERLAEDPDAPASETTVADLSVREVPQPAPVILPPPPLPPASESHATELEKCGKCGHLLEPSEVFCGACGASRDNSDIQSKWATLWHLRVASESLPSEGEHSRADSNDYPEYPTMDEIRAELAEALPDLAAKAAAAEQPDSGQAIETGETPISALHDDETNPDKTEPGDIAGPKASADAALVRQAVDSPQVWTSAAKARQWLDSVQSGKGDQPAQHWLTVQWRTQRANIYLAAAGILLLAVIFARPQSDPAAAAGKGSNRTRETASIDPKPHLTLFQRVLVGVGLAEAPPAPVYMGNPDTRVWVDLHTALYYCPGSDLYGNTPKGKYTTQRDAQQDQFEPALRKVCD